MRNSFLPNAQQIKHCLNSFTQDQQPIMSVTYNRPQQYARRQRSEGNSYNSLEWTEKQQSSRHFVLHFSSLPVWNVRGCYGNSFMNHSVISYEDVFFFFLQCAASIIVCVVSLMICEVLGVGTDQVFSLLPPRWLTGWFTWLAERQDERLVTETRDPGRQEVHWITWQGGAGDMITWWVDGGGTVLHWQQRSGFKDLVRSWEYNFYFFIIVFILTIDPNPCVHLYSNKNTDIPKPLLC